VEHNFLNAYQLTYTHTYTHTYVYDVYNSQAQEPESEWQAFTRWQGINDVNTE